MPEVAWGFRLPLGDGALTKADDGDGWWVAQSFGDYNPDFDSLHLGEDWNGEGDPWGDLGADVVSIGNGVVLEAGYLASLGNYMLIEHTLPYPIELNGEMRTSIVSLYAHLDDFTVTVGQEVGIGELIGHLGSTGDSDSPHLHFEIRLGTEFHDAGGYETPLPSGWIDPTEFITTHSTIPPAALDGPLTWDVLALLAEFANEAYDRDGTVLRSPLEDRLPAGWTVVNSITLPATGGYFESGYYAFDGDFSEGDGFVWNEIELFVAFNSATNTVVLSIRGTQGWDDAMNEWGQIPTNVDEVFEALEPFLTGLYAWVGGLPPVSGQAATLLITGHSMGGAVAEAIAARDTIQFDGGAFFGSPGSFWFDGLHLDDRFAHVTREQDFVGHALLLDQHAAATLTLDDYEFLAALPPVWPFGESHSPLRYEQQLDRIANSYLAGYLPVTSDDIAFLEDDGPNQFVYGADDAHGLDSVLFGSDIYRDVVSHDGFAGAFWFDGGGGADSISGSQYNDILAGGLGADDLEGKGGDDILAGGHNGDRYHIGIGQGYDIIDDAGREGTDVLRLYTGDLASVFDYDWFIVDGADLLVRIPDGNGGWAIDIRIKNMGSISNGIEIVELWAGDGMAQAVPAWSLAELWAEKTQPTPTQPGGPTGVNFENGDQYLQGTNGEDTFYIAGGFDTIDAQGGFDLLVADYSWMTGWLYSYVGPNGEYHISIRNSDLDIVGELAIGTGLEAVQIVGGAGHDALVGLAGPNILFGNDGNDGLVGGIGNDSLFGGLGNDRLHYNGGVDWMDGGEGEDRAFVNMGQSTSDILFIGWLAATDTGFTFLNGTHLQNIEGVNLTTGSGDDQIWIESYCQTITGAGDDRLWISGDLVGISGWNGGFGDDLLIADFSDSTNSIDLVDFGNSLQIGWGLFYGGYYNGISTTDVERFDVRTGAGTDHLTGWINDDVLSTNAGADSLDGRGGDDILDGGGGSDTIDGGDGNDTISGGADNDILDGGDDDDTFVFAAGDGVDTINGFSAGGTDDTIQVTGFATYTLVQEGANLRLVFDAQNSILLNNVLAASFTTADINISLEGAPNIINGSSASDTLSGTPDDDEINGLGGDDTLIGGTGSDALNGGDGTDTADYAAAGAGVGVHLPNGTATGGDGTDTLTSIENVTGSAFDDWIVGDEAANFLVGGYGNDSLQGHGGDDLLLGGDGNDALEDSGGGADRLEGGDGDDTLRGGAGDDLLAGGAGIDTVYYEAAGSGVTVLLSNYSASGGSGNDTLTGIENVVGSSSNDTFYGDAEANLLAGMIGDDLLYGLEGNDTLNGGDGDDVLNGGSGNDQLDGGIGTDTATYQTALAAVTVSLGLVDTQDTGGDGIDRLISIENLVGSAFNDTLTGDGNANALSGSEGDDTLAGNAGGDSLLGGSGGDNLFGGEGDDLLDGGTGADSACYDYASAGVTVSLALTGPQNTIGDGTDTLVDIEHLYGSLHDDSLTGNASANTLDGHDGADSLDGAGGNDFLNGGSGADRVIGGDGNDIVWGSAGDDVLSGGLGDDAFDGGDGSDTVDYGSANSAVFANLASHSATGGDDSDTLTSVENLVGSALNDALTGDDGANALTGGDGDDILSGGLGDDVLEGGAGDNLLSGGLGNDALNGGAGVDTVDYSAASAAVVVNLSSGTASGGDGSDTMAGIDNVIGSAFDDTITDDLYANVLDGGAGNDTINASYGADTLEGGDGDDALYGGDGNDVLRGGAGNDFLEGGPDADTLEGGAGDDVLRGSGGDDVLVGGDGVDTADYGASGSGVVASLAAGTATAVNVNGDGGDTLSMIENLSGSAFGDTLTGDAEANVLNGLAGVDAIVGGDGADTIIGGAGNDALDGGAGNDAFLFDAGDGQDTITGFTAGGTDDRIEVSGYTSCVVTQQGADLRILFDANNSILLTNVTLASFTAADINIAFTTAANAIVGTSGNDTLTGTSANEGIFGFGGNDTIKGNDGDDTIDGGDGNDVIEGGLGNDTLIGGAGTNDRADYRLASSAVSVNLALVTAQNTVGAGTDTLSGFEGVIGSAFNDTLTGNSGANTLDGRGGNDTLNGGAGGDTLIGGLGADAMNGGGDLDYASYVNATAGVALNLTTGVHTGEAAGDTFVNIERYRLSAFNDSFTGTANTDYAYGAEGDDTLNGAAGVDRLYGQDGIDTLNGDAGNDILLGGAGGDIFNGGADRDTASYEESTIAITMNLATGVHTGDATGDTFTSIEIFWLSAFNDTFTGGAGVDEVRGADGADTLNGAGGGDTLRGENGADILNGDDGDDFLYGGAGPDTLNGGIGIDTASYLLATAGVTVNLTSGTHTGEAAGDTFTSIEHFQLSNGFTLADSFTGSAGDDWVAGYKGVDTLNGMGGNDTLNGGAHDDVINGGDGADKIIGEAGNDSLTGGTGADQFRVTATLFGNDTITDFENGVDKIRVTGVAAWNDFSDVVVSTNGAGWAVVTFSDGSSITLTGMIATDVDASDFLWI